MDEKLLYQLKLLDEYLMILDDISKYDKESFLSDKILYKVFDIIDNNLIDIKRFKEYMLKFLKDKRCNVK